MTLQETLTDPKIEYESYITGPKGARFVLYPVKDKHTTEDVKRARQWLYREKDVVSLQIRWKREGDDAPPPEKIPDYIMLKELKKQLGEKESYIEELEDKIKQMTISYNQELDRDARKQVKSETLYKQLNAQLEKEKKTNNNLRATISELVTKLNKYEHNNGTNTQGNLG